MADNNRFWIAFGDVHEQVRALNGIVDLEAASGVLLSGDLTNIGNAARAQQVLTPIAQRNSRIHAQIGNMDTVAVDTYLSERNWNAHGQIRDLGLGVGLAAVGYSSPTPFGTPSEVSEDQLGDWLRGVLEKASIFDHVMLMVHNPPHNTLTDRLPSGVSVGSKAVRAAIEAFQPEVVITGHIHESYGQDLIGRSVIFNPGSFAQGGHVRIEHTASGLVGQLRRIA